jgi:enoyl-CoA hydratase
VHEFLKVEARGDVAIVRIDRPPANAMIAEMADEGAAVLEQLLADEPAAVVLTGTGGVFSAGVDLKIAPTLDAEGQNATVMGINRMATAWYGFPRPVVCAVTGHAIAGGMVLAMCADHRVGSTEGKLGFTEVRAGVPYPAVAIAVVAAELEPRVVRDLVLSGRLVDPQEALRIGLVDELAEPADVLDRALAVAEERAALPSGAYARIKEQLRGELLARARRVVEDEDEPLLTTGWTSGETADAAARTLHGGG